MIRLDRTLQDGPVREDRTQDGAVRDGDAPLRPGLAGARTGRSKIRSLEELAALAAEARAAGRRVVLAHGVFDLLHLGHVRHFEAARRHGDVLMVTVTADPFVNKGPGRPVFADYLRAEMVGAVGAVDFVAINPAPDAIELLRRVRPDVYAKGADYADPAADVTGKIARERDAVVEAGGRLVFTDEAVSSSTELINRHFNLGDPAIRRYLDGLRQSSTIAGIEALLDAVAHYRVLVVGDAIIDEYQYVTPMNKSPKENMIATLFRENEVFAGGVVAAANHLAGFCRQVDVVTVTGAADSQEALLRRSCRANVGLQLVERPGVPTTRKCRFVDPGYMRKLFEVYRMDDTPLDAELTARLDALIGAAIESYDLVLVTDFGHGMIGPSTIRLLTERARFLAVNTQTNSANLGFNLISKYPKAGYVCIDAPEARLATHEKHLDIRQIASQRIPALVACSRIIITHGQQGCVVHAAGSAPGHIPALTKTVVDTVGAGDAFLAVTAPLVAADGPMETVGFIGNVAGALKVATVGHRASVDKAALLKSVKALLA